MTSAARNSPVYPVDDMTTPSGVRRHKQLFPQQTYPRWNLVLRMCGECPTKYMQWYGSPPGAAHGPAAQTHTGRTKHARRHSVAAPKPDAATKHPTYGRRRERLRLQRASRSDG